MTEADLVLVLHNAGRGTYDCEFRNQLVKLCSGAMIELAKLTDPSMSGWDWRQRDEPDAIKLSVWREPPASYLSGLLDQAYTQIHLQLEDHKQPDGDVKQYLSWWGDHDRLAGGDFYADTDNALQDYLSVVMGIDISEQFTLFVAAEAVYD